MTQAPRIVSLAPAATEILVELGLGEQVVGVSHECDVPASIRHLPRLTVPPDEATSSAAIAPKPRRLIDRGLGLWDTDCDALVDLAPDLIITQHAPGGSAITAPQLAEATGGRMGEKTNILSLSPRRLADVFADMGRIAAAAAVADRAEPFVRRLRRRLDTLRRQVAPHPRRTTLVLDGLDPPRVAGHWIPELVDAAGGTSLVAEGGAPSQTISWRELADADPQVIIVAPCGFKVDRTLAELGGFSRRPEVAGTRAARSGYLAVIDGKAFFNRPGPRLIDSAEIAAAAIRRGTVDEPAKDHMRRLGRP